MRILLLLLFVLVIRSPFLRTAPSYVLRMFLVIFFESLFPRSINWHSRNFSTRRGFSRKRSADYVSFL